MSADKKPPIFDEELTSFLDELNSRKLTAKEIILKNIIVNMLQHNMTPWSYLHGVKQGVAMNYVSEQSYRGLNRILIYLCSEYHGGEFLTFNQLKDYNEKHKTDYRLKKNSAVPIMFYTKTMKKVDIDTTTLNTYKKTYTHPTEGDYYYDSKTRAVYLQQTNGTVVQVRRVYKYYNIFNILDTADADGNPIPSKLDVEEDSGLKMVYSDAETTINNYLTRENIKRKLSVEGSCGYSLGEDCIYIPPTSYFSSHELYYRVILHELVHSTGVPTRLDRKSLIDFSKSKSIRGKEEVVAELGANLLATECNIATTEAVDKNSVAYIVGWARWIKDNFEDFLGAIYDAERAVEFILPVVNEGLETISEEIAQT